MFPSSRVNSKDKPVMPLNKKEMPHKTRNQPMSFSCASLSKIFLPFILSLVHLVLAGVAYAAKRCFIKVAVAHDALGPAHQPFFNYYCHINRQLVYYCLPIFKPDLCHSFKNFRCLILSEKTEMRKWV